MIFSRTYSPRIGDYNSEGTLSLRSILEMLEDVASCHSEAVKDNVIEGSQNGIAWVLVEWNIEIISETMPGEELLFHTWVTGKAPTSSVIREIEVCNKNEEPILFAMARFVLLDRSTGRLTRISSELFESYLPEHNVKHDFSTSRMCEIREYQKETTLKVRKADIDFNGHVHNTVYMDYVDELSEIQKKQIKSFRIGYKTPVIANEELTIKQYLDSKEHLGIYRADGTLCTLIEVGTVKE